MTSPREGTKIEVNENTNQLMRMLRHGDKGLTDISDEIHMDKSNKLNNEYRT